MRVRARGGAASAVGLESTDRSVGFADSCRPRAFIFSLLQAPNTMPTLTVHDPHTVKFYRDEPSLFATVAGFLGQGLVDGQPALLIATAAHRVGILRELSARLIDVDRAMRTRELIVLDASDTLDLFMRGEAIDATAFESVMGAVLDGAVRGRTLVVVRAFGEMVDVLWKQGRHDAAIRLEILWNALATRYNFALLCGYSMGHFFTQTGLFEEVCRQHSHVMPPDAKVGARPINGTTVTSTPAPAVG